MRDKTATFIGHSECYGVKREDVSAAARELIEKGITDFLCGGMGDFDWIAARAVYELKNEYPHVSVNLVIPYLTFNIRNKELFDAIIYPDGFEKYHFKSAILQRNRYMVKESAYAICYVIRAAMADTWDAKKRYRVRGFWVADEKTMCFDLSEGVQEDFRGSGADSDSEE